MKKLILLFTLVCIAFHIHGQTGTDTLRYVIETTDGNEYLAKILESTDEYILVQTEIFPELKIPKSAVKSMKKVTISDMNKGEYWFKNPHSTRYFYSPNGYNLQRNEGYYQNTWVFFNQVSYGFSENFSVGVGMIPLFLVGADIAPVWITPKLGIPLIKDKLNLGIGVLAGTVLGEGEGLGIAYTTLSYGSRDKNSTIGGGWAYSSDGWAKYPTLSFSAMSRFSKKGFFITENYLISTAYETIGLISLGGRSVQKKLAIDYGLIFPVNSGADVCLAIPWLSITVPFGNKITQE